MTPETPTGTPTSGDPEERYERLGRIASGGMGEVWRARDRVLGREVAVKVLRAEYADDTTFRARFEGEARHAAALHHPGIASVFDYGVSNGAPYLVMELVDGKPLSDLLASGRPFDPDQARQLVAQAADALAVAHAAGVVHRDVKPANLLVTPDGRVKITDFGIARAVDAVPLTQTGQIVGTPHYLSPEQARGDAATSASDVYALGVVLFECLAGHRPFSADTPVATALAHLQQEVPPLPDTVPAPLAAVARRALAKDPAQRYADGGQLATALREGDAAVPAGAATVVDRPTEPDHTRVLPPVAAAAGAAGAAATRVTTVSDRPAPVSSRPDRSRWPLYAGAALLLLLLVVLLLTRPWEDGASTTTSPTADPTPTAQPAKKSSQPSTKQPEQPTTEAAPETVEVNADDYVGRQAEDVEKDLEALGLKTSTQTVDNPGDQEAGVVSALSPTGTVEKGRTITLQAYGEPAPVETPTPPVSTDLPGGAGKGPGNGPGTGPGTGNGADKGPGNGKGN